MRFSIVVGILIGLMSAAADFAHADDKHALLIGCTRYPNVERLPELYGPANDIPLWHKLLTAPSPGGFAFAEQNVQQLVGWPDDVSLRPTRANIAAAFDSLIAKSLPDSQFVIVLSGHGTQQPIPEGQDPFDPQNSEPDGLDEVFLPADVSEGSPVIRNGIVDNQISTWLEQMRAKGANVWIVFDCCHSGTMTRGTAEDGERTRNVEPAVLGISQKLLDDAARLVEVAASKRSKDGLPPFVIPEKIAAISDAKKNETGSLVAFYAAQPFERAPELPLPEGKPHIHENFYGLLSYTLVQTLLERRSPLSYRELSRLLASSYRARRGTRFPTPFAEGDLDREVLSARVWPVSSEMFIDRNSEDITVNAGELHGLTVDSVLTVHPPIDDARDPKTVLGYVMVQSVSPTTAIVRACPYNDHPEISDVPHLSRCEIASRNFGEMRIKVFADQEPRLQVALKDVRKEVAAQIQITNVESEAQWRLCVVTPADAIEYGLPNIVEDHVVLLAGAGQQRAGDPPSGPRKYFAAYAVANTQTLAGALDRDFPKLFRWQNLWRVSSGVNSMDGGETNGLKFEAFKLANLQDQTDEPMRGGLLRSGDIVKFTLKNEGVQNVWVTLLYLDANLGVKHVYSGQIEAGRDLRPFRFRMTSDGNSAGPEGMIAFASPATDKTAPDFSFLEQEPLLVESDRTKGIGDVPSTPFGQLLKTAAFNNGTRGMQPVVSTTPAIIVQTWLLVP